MATSRHEAQFRLVIGLGGFVTFGFVFLPSFLYLSNCDLFLGK
jgi:hypothetical protein